MLGKEIKFELTPDVFVTIPAEYEGEPIGKAIDEIYGFELYGNSTLADVLKAIDEHPYYYEILRNDEITDEIGSEMLFAEMEHEPLSLISRLYLQVFLNRINGLVLSYYPDLKIIGEETLFGMIVFEDDYSDVQALQRLKDLPVQLNDVNGEVKKVLEQKHWEQYGDIFYIFKIGTFY